MRILSTTAAAAAAFTIAATIATASPVDGPNTAQTPEAKVTPEPTPEPETEKQVTEAVTDDQMTLYQAECDARRRRGLAPRILDAALCRLAQARARQIARRFRHENIPAGASENIAANGSGPRQAIVQWTNSSGHARAMFGGRLIGGYGVHRSGGQTYAVTLYRSTSLDKPVQGSGPVIQSCPGGNCPAPSSSSRPTTRRGPLGIFRWRVR